MKKLLFLILLLPSYCMAQGDLLGKSRAAIKAQFKAAKVALIDSNSFYGSTYSDSFKTNGETVICSYGKDMICTEVIKTMKLSLLDATKAKFNTDYDKKDGETFSTDVWADKTKAFKVHISVEKMVNMMYLDYLPYSNPYVVH